MAKPLKRKTYYGKTCKEVQEKLRVALNEQKQGTLIKGPQQTLQAVSRTVAGGSA